MPQRKEEKKDAIEDNKHIIWIIGGLNEQEDELITGSTDFPPDHNIVKYPAGKELINQLDLLEKNQLPELIMITEEGWSYISTQDVEILKIYCEQRKILFTTSSAASEFFKLMTDV